MRSSLMEKTLRDFIKEYPDVDYGVIRSVYISCVGGKGDIYEAFEHVIGCFYCRRLIETGDQDGSARGIFEQMERRVKERTAEMDARLAEVERKEDFELYQSGAFGI